MRTILINDCRMKNGLAVKVQLQTKIQKIREKFVTSIGRLFHFGNDTYSMPCEKKHFNYKT